jgi:S1-C subfamily serine protease
MKRMILAAVLLLAVALPASSAKPAYLASIRPLQMLAPVMVMTDEGPAPSPTGEQALRNICTTTSINSRGYWITAGHCVANLEKHILDPRLRFIEGHLADVVAITYEGDMAILHTEDFALPAVKLSKKAPTWLDPVIMAGHPFGLSAIFVVPGTVANPFAMLDGDPEPYMLFTLPIAGGNSGSCVFNAAGEVISIAQIGFGPGYTPEAGGAPYWHLRQFALKYFGQ